MYGPSKWQEILAIEADLRKQKREHEHRQMEIKQKVIEWGAGFVIFVLCVGALIGFVWLGTKYMAKTLTRKTTEILGGYFLMRLVEMLVKLKIGWLQ